MNINQLFLWGSFPYKTPQGNPLFPSSKFQFKQPIRHVACGVQHILFASNEELYGIGSNSEGQLGLVDSVKVDQSIRKLPFPNRIIKQISCGDYFSVVLTHEGDVFCAGEGMFGAVGTGSDNNINSLTKIMEGVISISAGSRHVLALNQYGMVYGWGDNQQGQLGSRLFGKTVLEPKLLKLRDVVQISAYRNTSLFLKDEQIYGCGGNDLGQLGVGHKNIVSEIQKIQMQVKISFIQAGNYTCVHSLDEQYYFFGSGAFGQLLYPVKMSFPNISQIYIGQTYGFYKDIYHQIHGWGSNLHGEMGIETPTRFFTPTPMPHLNKFTSFICGKNFVIGFWNPQFSQQIQYDTNIPVQLQSQRLKDHIALLECQLSRTRQLLQKSKPQYYNVLMQLQSLKQQNLKLKQQLYLQKSFNQPKLVSQINKSEEEKQRLKTLLHQVSSISSDRQQYFLSNALQQQINNRKRVNEKDQTLFRVRNKYGDLLNKMQNNSFVEEIYEYRKDRQQTEERKVGQYDGQKLQQFMKHTGNLRKIMEQIYQQSIQ